MKPELLDLLKQLAAYDEAYAKRALAYALKVAEQQTGTARISCNGCSFCCYTKIVSPIIPGALIYLHLKETGRWNEEMKKKLYKAEQDYLLTSHYDFMKERKPCVFLDTTAGFGKGHCTVYQARPIGCRATFSILEPEKCCEPDIVASLQVMLDPSGAEIRLFVEAELAMVAGPRFFTLPGAVLYAAAVLEEAPLPNVFSVDAREFWQSGGDMQTYFDLKGQEAALIARRNHL